MKIYKAAFLKCFCVVILILLVFSSALFAEKIGGTKIEDPIKYNVRINGAVNWRGEDRDSISTMKSNFVIRGTMKMRWQAMGGYAKDFEIDQMQVNYSHLVQVYKKKPGKDCSELLKFEVKASGSLPITKGSLSILYEEKVPADHPLKQSMLHFSFSPDPVRGKMKTLDDYDCKHTIWEIDLGIADVNVTDTSKISKDQTSFSGSRSYGIPPDTSLDGFTESMPFFFSDKVLSFGLSSLPKEIDESIISSAGDNLVVFQGFSTGGKAGMPPGNDAQLSWKIEIGPSVEIWRDDRDITDETVQVVVGEKVKLRGIVIPEEKDTGKGQWTVPGRTIQEFVVEGDWGHADWLEEQDLEAQELAFHWWDGEDGLEVQYATTSTDGKSLTGTAVFDVKEPETVLRAYLSKGKFKVGEVKYEDVDGTIHEGTELVLNTGTAQTICFDHEPLPAEFQPGATQFVQYVWTEGRVIRDKEVLAGPCIQIKMEGLDGHYPYAPGSETRDSPGAPVSIYDLTIVVENRFTMQLMYKPEIDGAIFVPLSELVWSWTGNCSRSKITDDWNTDGSNVSAQDNGTPAEAYLEWDRIGTGEETWDACE